MLNVNETVTSIKPCYKIRYLSLKIWRYAESPYLCNVFFIVIRFISLNNLLIRQFADVLISGAIYAHTVIGILAN